MIVFLLKSSACLAVFLVFYKLVLEKERMHRIKRFYLLAALMLALAVPSITFTEYVERPSDLRNIVSLQTLAPENRIAKTALPSSMGHPVLLEQKTWMDYWINYKTGFLWTVYVLGVVLFALKFLIVINRIIQNVRKHPKIRKGGLQYVLLGDDLVPHTFFNYIFLNRKKFENNEIPKDVLLHEAAHARQKHSLDVLFVELLRILLWFNPLIHWTEKAIKLNHEFLADEAVLEQGIPTSDYQNILLSFASSAKFKRYQPSMANAINYSIKKRFKVMKTHTSRKSILVRTLMIAPLFALVLFGFSTTVQERKEPISILPSEQKAMKTASMDSGDQEGATKKQLIEYNRLAKKYNDMLAEEGNIWIEKSDVERLEHLYGVMTEEQRGNAEPYPDFPEPPEAPMPPTSPSEMNVEQRRYQLEKQSEEIDRQAALIQEQVEKIEQKTMQLQQQSHAMEKQRREIEKNVQEIIENQEIYDVGRRNDFISKSLSREQTQAAKRSFSSPPAPPSPPKPKSLPELLEELKNEDVKIIIDGKEVDYDKAKKRFETDSFSKINVKQVTGKRPIIKVTTEK